MIGANGIGKTTLLKSILGLIPPLAGKCELGDYLQIGYFEQEMAPGNADTCIQEMWNEFPGMNQFEVRAALAKCGLTTKHIESQVRVLSGGEQAKVRLCKLINRDSHSFAAGRTDQSSGCGCQGGAKAGFGGSSRKLASDLSRAAILSQDVVTDVWDCSKWTTKLV